VQRQTEDATKLAGIRRWEVRRTYVDNDYSAFDKKVVRPQFEQLLTDLESGAIDGIVTYDVDRFVRQPADLERAIDIYDSRDELVFATVQGDIDLSTANGRTMARVMVAFANKSSMDASRRIKRKNLQRAEDGTLTGSHRPFGYEEDKRTIRESEAALVRQAADDIIAGMGTHAIARRWNQLGVKTAQGNTWVQSVVRTMMASPRMAGFQVYHGEILIGNDGQPVTEQRDALLTVETWESMCAVMLDPARSGNHVHPGGRKRLLAGIVRCGLCFLPLSGDKDRRRNVHTYVCKPATTHHGCGKIGVSGERVDELVTDLVIIYLSQRQVHHSRSSWAGEDELTNTIKRISELMAHYSAGDLSGEIVIPAVRELDAKRGKLSEAKRDWLREQAHFQSQPTDIATIWPGLDTERRRNIIESVIEAVIVKPAKVKGGRFSPDRIDIRWRQ
jgi:DNA invertase Pin-like site-specific DNA recombinase